MNILFVCTGNTCRSVIAEYLLKKLTKDLKDKINVSSAGIFASLKGEIPRETIDILRKEGIWGIEHRIKPITERLVRESDLILVMESYHLQFLIKRFPEAKDKIFLLREFAEAGEGDIFDPFGGSIEGYETCLQEIKRCLPHVIRKIGYRRLVVLGSDHAGYDLKEEIKRFLDEMQFEYIDFGPVGVDSVDYPDFGIKVAEHVSLSKCWRGILICATGIGMSIVANKIPGIRAAICHNREVARLAREHNDANILIIGSKIVKWEDVREMVKIFLTTEASGGRHARRVNKIREIERKYLKGEE